MRTITPDELNTILENHRHWLNEDCEGWEYMKADLRRANLRRAYLIGANLSGADLRRADLIDADLSGADLSGANLRRAYLIGANLSGADLRRAYLIDADLSGANLIGADLSGADLSGANLRRAYLIGANLIGANLIDANLIGANLSGANGIVMTCPSDGAFIGWKKARSDSGLAIVKLEIMEDAKRSSATGRKCRCDKAKVLAVYDMEGNAIEKAYSDRDNNFIYTPGEIVEPDSFDENRWIECSNGIHFFITRKEAEEYEL